MNVDQWNKLKSRYPMLYSFITIRQENEGGFIFNPYLFNERWVDQAGFNVLKFSDGTHSVSDIIKHISQIFRQSISDSERIVCSHLQDLERYFAIKLMDKPIQNTSVPKSNHIEEIAVKNKDYYSAPLSVLWDITYRCNMRCRHCLIEDEFSATEMSLDEVERVMRELRRMKVFNITFSGGEPLLRGDLLDILGIASKLNFGIRLSTNGLLLSDNLLEKMGSLDVYCIQISLDGVGESHDTLRNFKGAYVRAVDALRRASDSGFYTIMSTMITSHNYREIGDLFDLAVSIGVSSFKLNTFIPMGEGKKSRDQLHLPPEKLRELAKEIINRKHKYEGTIDMQLNALFPWLLKSGQILQERRPSQSAKLKCSAGHSNLVISPEGTIYPCPYLTCFPIGNILEDSLKDIWNSKGILAKFRNLRQKDLKGKCHNCHYVPAECNGGCRAAAYIEKGDFHSEDPFCWNTIS